jgi:hypothetical protein
MPCRGCTGLQIPHIKAGFLSLFCPVLHRIALPMVSEWYQVKSGACGLRVAGLFANQIARCEGVRRIDEAKPRRETSTSVYASPAHSPRADIRAGLTHVVLTTMHRTGDYGRFWPCRTGPMHDPASGLRRIYLPRTRVNKERKGPQGFAR